LKSDFMMILNTIRFLIRLPAVLIGILALLFFGIITVPLLGTIELVVRLVVWSYNPKIAWKTYYSCEFTKSGFVEQEISTKSILIDTYL